MSKLDTLKKVGGEVAIWGAMIGIAGSLCFGMVRCGVKEYETRKNNPPLKITKVEYKGESISCVYGFNQSNRYAYAQSDVDPERRAWSIYNDCGGETREDSSELIPEICSDTLGEEGSE